jgi:glutamate-ammonia-ligase adenylyltransferase
LRPSGRAGPLATHIRSFEDYQRSEAWTWEHMAMSRGRPVAGDPALMADVSAVLDRIVGVERDRARLGTEIADMRARIEREKRSAGPFDVKLASGGLIDCEFAAQFLVLAGVGRVEGEPTLDTLRRAFSIGALRPSDGESLVKSILVQSTILQILRVASESAFDPERAPDALKGILVSAAGTLLGGEGNPPLASFGGLQAALENLQRETRTSLEAVLASPVSPKS